MKSIFLTTLDRTRYRDEMEYFSCGDPAGGSFITGISLAEGGIKYILARHRVDEVIVIGPESFAGTDLLKSEKLTIIQVL